MDTAHDVLGVLGRPDALGAVQGQIEGVLADNPDRGHCHFDPAAAIMGVHHHKIGGNLVPGDDVSVGHLRQHPHLFATLQGAGSFIGHTLAQQVVSELKSVLVLHNLIAV